MICWNIASTYADEPRDLSDERRGGWVSAAQRRIARLRAGANAIGESARALHAHSKITRPHTGTGRIAVLEENGAGEAIRTPDPNLGKVVLYP